MKCISQNCNNTALPNKKYCIPCDNKQLSYNKRKSWENQQVKTSIADRNYKLNSSLKDINRNSNNSWTITMTWLNQHKTEAGGYTAAQLKALGFKDFNKIPKKWKYKICNRKISISQKIQFEEGKFIFSKKSKKNKKDYHSLLLPLDKV